MKHSYGMPGMPSYYCLCKMGINGEIVKRRQLNINVPIKMITAAKNWGVLTPTIGLGASASTNFMAFTMVLVWNDNECRLRAFQAFLPTRNLGVQESKCTAWSQNSFCKSPLQLLALLCLMCQSQTRSVFWCLHNCVHQVASLTQQLKELQTEQEEQE